MMLSRTVMLLEVLLLSCCAVLYVFGSPPLLLWLAATALAILTIGLLLLGFCTTANRRASKALAAPMPKIDINKYNEIAFHQVRMKYAWDWFQYHADQRLKSFNFFLIILGILVVAYGTAMKEGLANSSAMPKYSHFAAVVAFCGVVISLAFFIIELRNVELVDCGRNWLEYLEGGLEMSLRREDRDREHLDKSVGWLPGGRAPRKAPITHWFWMRTIYGMACLGFVVALSYALWGF